jgi:Protein of unknown function (DUF1329)
VEQQLDTTDRKSDRGKRSYRMKLSKMIRGWFKGSALLLLLLIVATNSAWAADSKSGAGEIPPGTKITMSNWQQYQQFMSDGMKALFRGDHFFQLPPDVQIDVTATKPIGMPKAYRDATEKYAGQVQLKEVSPGVYEPSPYVAGLPFPNPFSGSNDPLIIGQKIYWNTYYRPRPVTDYAPNCSDVVDHFGNMTRTADTNIVFTVMQHLANTGYPQTLPNNAGYFGTFYGEQVAPEQGKYTTEMSITPQDPLATEELYAYIPSLRRSLRLTQAARCSPIFGTDFTFDDEFPPTMPQLFNIRYVRSTKLLFLIHQNIKSYSDCGESTQFSPEYNYPMGAHRINFPRPSAGAWELRDTYLIDFKRKPQYDKGYCYGDRLMYVDRDTYFPLVFDIWDKAGKFYKSIQIFNVPLPVPASAGDEVLTLGIAYGFVANFLDEHGSIFSGRLPICLDHDCDSRGFSDIDRYALPDGLMKIGQ